jgi:hypothetical protein
VAATTSIEMEIRHTSPEVIATDELREFGRREIHKIATVQEARKAARIERPFVFVTVDLLAQIDSADQHVR